MSRMSVIVLAIGVSLSSVRFVTDGPAGRAGGKEKRPGRPFGPPPGAFGSAFKVASLSLHHDAPGEGLNKAQAKQQSQKQGQARRHQRDCRRRHEAQSSGDALLASYNFGQWTCGGGGFSDNST